MSSILHYASLVQYFFSKVFSLIQTVFQMTEAHLGSTQTFLMSLGLDTARAQLSRLGIDSSLTPHYMYMSLLLVWLDHWVESVLYRYIPICENYCSFSGAIDLFSKQLLVCKTRTAKFLVTLLKRPRLAPWPVVLLYVFVLSNNNHWLQERTPAR